MIRTDVARGIASLAGVSVVSAAAHATVLPTVDDFDTGPVSLVVNYTNPGTSTDAQAMQMGLAGTLGGHRITSLEYEAPPPDGVSPSLRARARVGSGNFAFSNDSGVKSRALLVYNGSTDPLAGALNFDAAAVLANAIRIDFLRADLPLLVSLGLGTAIGTPDEARGTVNDIVVPASDSPFSIVIPFASVIPNPGQTFDFTDLDAIGLLFEPERSGDFALDAIAFVPTPGAAAMLSAGGLLALRRRRTFI